MISSADILKASILIVDDQEANVSLLEQTLSEAGYVSITSTRNPREVCELHRQNRYDLILLDLQMPGMDGFQVMESLKAIETGGYLPVLVITAQPDQKLRALKAGAKDFVGKPFDLAEVLLRVYNMLEVRLLHLESEARTEQAETRSVQAIRASELRYRRLFETAQDGILILDADTGQVVDANPFMKDLLGYSQEEFLGKKLWEIGPFKGTEAAKVAFAELQHTDRIRYEGLPLETKDGRRVEVEFISNAYLVDQKRLIQCNIRNITERKLAEAKLKEYSRKLQELSRRLVEAQETERRNIARELHDELGQTLTVAQLNLQALLQSPGTRDLARLKESLEAVERVLEQVRDISLNLRPSMLDDLGLEPALVWLTNRQAELTGLKGEVQADALDHRLDPMIETECFRITQEALTNVVRHAQAKTVTVELRKEDGQLHLRVRDDGIGFEVAGVREKAVRGASLGLLSMEERAALTGGGLEFTSIPRRGSEVHAWFPLKWQTQPSGSETP